MSHRINDWKPEAASLVRSLQRAGFKIVSADNGEEKEKFRSVKQIVSCLTACDESRLYFSHPTETRPMWVYIVLGNSPGEMPSDYCVRLKPDGHTETEASLMLDKVIQSHWNRWEKKPQPIIG